MAYYDDTNGPGDPYLDYYDPYAPGNNGSVINGQAQPAAQAAVPGSRETATSANPWTDPATGTRYDGGTGQYSAFNPWLAPKYTYSPANYYDPQGNYIAPGQMSGQQTAPAGTGTGTGTDTGGPQGGDYKTWFMNLVSGKTPNSATLKSLEPELAKYGITIAYNAAGIAHKIKLPTGEIVRVGDYFDSAPGEGFTQAWNWVGGGGTAGSSGGAKVAPPAPSPMVTPNGGVPAGVPYNPAVPAAGSYRVNEQRAGFTQTPPTYTPQTFSQFQTPDYSNITGLQDKVLQDTLTNPMYSPEYVNRMNEAQKELINTRGAAAQGNLLQGAVSRGVAKGGAVDVGRRRLETEQSRNLLSSQRDIFNTAEAGNRQGFLDALAASQGTLTGRGNQATQFYNTLLGGQQAQAGELGRGYQSQMDAFNALLNRDVGLESLQQDQAS